MFPLDTTKVLPAVTSVALDPLQPDTGVKNAFILSASPPSTITFFPRVSSL